MKTPRASGMNVVGLDVGTTKVCAIVGKEDQGKIGISAVGLAPSSGLRKGVVVDRDLAAASIRKAIRDASDKAGIGITSAYVGIAGGHIKGFAGKGTIAIKDRLVREDDIARLIDSAGAVYVPVERDVLHVVPAGFRLDGRNGITDPLGMSGSRLEANVHIVTGSVTSVQDLIACCRKAGVEVLDIVLEPLASAGAILSEAEKKAGVILVDIGGGTTDIAFYQGGMLRHTAVLALGGNHLTNDVAVGLGVSGDEAEQIKKKYGYALAHMAEEARGGPDVFEVTGKDGKSSEVSLRYLSEITQARCEEFIGLVKKEMDNVSSRYKATAVVLTGGTALVKGIRELAQEMFALPARIGVPGDIQDKGLVRSPIYATGVGLVRYGLSRHVLPDLEAGGILERMKKWVSGFLYEE
ncbi:MAG TPA: cell division protein FtsA [Thermodesulfovibrionales bacterium]|nr:cell division protein FtsA [Thermodesulfovibrionales bacterium]